MTQTFGSGLKRCVAGQVAVLFDNFSYDRVAGEIFFSPPKEDANQPPVVVLPEYDMVF